MADAIRSTPSLYGNVFVDAFVVMPDHIHLIVALTEGRDGARPLPDIIGRLKSYTARQYRLSGAPFGFPLWQRGYYEHVIRGDADLAECRRYLQNNPLKMGHR